MMKNILKTLIYDGQVSLTVLDTTEIVKKAETLHGLSPAATLTLGKTMTVMAYASACLKETTGKISVTIKGDGLGGAICVSGDEPLHIRGYIENAQATAEVGDEEFSLTGAFGTMTVVRDDGYSRPFVGACELDISGEIDRNFEKYYTVSEQLPTYISTFVKRDEQGKCVFAGGIVLQPLPFAPEETLAEMPVGDDLDKICETLPELGIDGVAETYFQASLEDATYKYAIYQCHCSRAYLAEVIASLGETQTRQIIQEDGAVRIHCHYCNTEYEFTEADADKIFKTRKE